VKGKSRCIAAPHMQERAKGKNLLGLQSRFACRCPSLHVGKEVLDTGIGLHGYLQGGVERRREGGRMRSKGGVGKTCKDSCRRMQDPTAFTCFSSLFFSDSRRGRGNLRCVRFLDCDFGRERRKEGEKIAYHAKPGLHGGLSTNLILLVGYRFLYFWVILPFCFCFAALLSPCIDDEVIRLYTALSGTHALLFTPPFHCPVPPPPPPHPASCSSPLLSHVCFCSTLGLACLQKRWEDWPSRAEWEDLGGPRPLSPRSSNSCRVDCPGCGLGRRR
jgi:hypothetical protein